MGTSWAQTKSCTGQWPFSTIQRWFYFSGVKHHDWQKTWSEMTFLTHCFCLISTKYFSKYTYLLIIHTNRTQRVLTQRSSDQLGDNNLKGKSEFLPFASHFIHTNTSSALWLHPLWGMDGFQLSFMQSLITLMHNTWSRLCFKINKVRENSIYSFVLDGLRCPMD